MVSCVCVFWVSLLLLYFLERSSCAFWEGHENDHINTVCLVSRSNVRVKLWP